jgi:hypothetical protein
MYLTNVMKQSPCEASNWAMKINFRYFLHTFALKLHYLKNSMIK